MRKMLLAGAVILLVVLASNGPALGQNTPNISFFITSAGSGNGANLGGLAGAKMWRAYLSTSAAGNQAAVNARDRIGRGPWQNAKGVVVAQNVDDLHSDKNRLGKEGSLTEKGAMVNGRGDSPNMHDILTGSSLDGRALPGDMTCNNWTSGAAGSARVGHHDKQGGGENPTSWNSAHASSGCSQANLVSTGGAGLFYCFAQ
jgi:hypothetical protein